MKRCLQCSRKASAKGRCSIHYMRWMRGSRITEDAAQADMDGYQAGLRGIEQTKDYRTGAEYIAWLGGWRRAREPKQRRAA